MDLADPPAAAARLRAWLGAQDGDGFATASLVNNAAALTRIGALEDCTAEELSRDARVGLEAPLLLTAALLGATATRPGQRRVLNISSGLRRRAMAGQANYCATKAGLDHLSRAGALDQAQLTHGARIVSLAPGVIDTDMQSELRAASIDGFPDHDDFVRLKQDGQLASPDEAAARVIAWLERADFGASPAADVRDAWPVGREQGQRRLPLLRDGDVGSRDAVEVSRDSRDSPLVPRYGASIPAGNGAVAIRHN